MKIPLQGLRQDDRVRIVAGEYKGRCGTVLEIGETRRWSPSEETFIVNYKIKLDNPPYLDVIIPVSYLEEV